MTVAALFSALAKAPAGAEVVVGLSGTSYGSVEEVEVVGDEFQIRSGESPHDCETGREMVDPSGPPKAA